MERFKELIKKNIETITISLLFIIILGESFIIYRSYKDSNQTVSNSTSNISLGNNNEEQKELLPRVFYVDIKGEVNKPGVYEVEENDRVSDVITLAGGLTKNASTEANNLGLKITDEMVIIIYSKSQIKDFKKVKEEEKLVSDKCNDSKVKNDSCVTNNDSKDNSNNNQSNSSSLISINTATEKDLMTLPGIGAAKAKSIIDFRNANGNFNTVEDIKKVSGIGDSIFAQIKDLITI